MRALYVAWQDPTSRNWFPVGRLTFENGTYRFVYTKGAMAQNFTPFGRMRDLNSVYESNELFPLFANRLLAKGRPEYQDLLDWVNLADGNQDPIALLSRTGGIRETDSLMVFPCPEPSPDGRYQVHFFSHGIRHLGDDAIRLIDSLHPGAQLFLMPDPQNPFDQYAIALRTNDPATIVGYCPRYLTKDFLRVLEECGPTAVSAEVEKVNQSAPIQLRLLCSLTALWPAGFRPCSDELYQPLATEQIPTAAHR